MLGSIPHVTPAAQSDTLRKCLSFGHARISSVTSLASDVFADLGTLGTGVPDSLYTSTDEILISFPRPRKEFRKGVPSVPKTPWQMVLGHLGRVFSSLSLLRASFKANMVKSLLRLSIAFNRVCFDGLK